MDNYLKNLNEEQLKPVLDTDGALLVTAGAGSGKTRVLTSRIAYLIKSKNVYPYNILAITFTNKAAREMQERLKDMVENSQDIWVLTIHKMCVRILRRSADLIGYDTRFTIYTDNERERVIKKIIKLFEIDDDKVFKAVKFHIDRAKMQGQNPDEYLSFNKGEKYIDTAVKIYQAYERELKAANALDFDDLLIKTYELLAFKKEALDYYSNKFRYIHIDEFQDTNALQYKIIKLLTVKHGNIFAVGDDDQSIYGWRGAQIENMLSFEKDFKNAKMYKLERNYRSTKNILDAANYIIKNNRLRREKRLWTQGELGEKIQYFEAADETIEAAQTAAIINGFIARGEKASDFAVLMRLNALSRPYEQEFTRLNIPTVIYGGQKFFDRKEIKDLTAYLRLINNPSDNDALLRIINTPKRGIGEKTVAALLEDAREKNITLFDTLLDADELELSQGTKTKLIEFSKILSSLIIASQSVGILKLIEELIEKTQFMSMFETKDFENENRRYNINEFVSSVDSFAKTSPSATLNDYLEYISLNTDTDQSPQAESVTLATMHAVKGLEFKTVFVCGLDAGIMPIVRAGDVDIEEERRLLYVAITRAKKRLYLTRAKSRFLYGERNDTARSSFLNELAGIAGLEIKDYRQSYAKDYGETMQNKGVFNRYKERYSSFDDYESSNFRQSSAETNLLGAFKSSKTTQGTKSSDQFKSGDVVVHTKFGEGRIIAVKGSGKSAVADIAFVDKKYAIKQLALAFAPLSLKK